MMSPTLHSLGHDNALSSHFDHRGQVAFQMRKWSVLGRLEVLEIADVLGQQLHVLGRDLPSLRHSIGQGFEGIGDGEQQSPGSPVLRVQLRHSAPASNAA